MNTVNQDQFENDDLDDFETLSVSQLEDRRRYWLNRLRMIRNTRIAAYMVSGFTLLLAVATYFIPPINTSIISSFTGFLVPLFCVYLLRHHVIHIRAKISNIDNIITNHKISLEKNPAS